MSLKLRPHPSARASLPTARCTSIRKARIKRYHKEGQALRTEITINNTRDFYIGKSLANLSALRKIGFQRNRRVLDIQTIAHDSILAEETLQQLQRPRVVERQRVSSLRLADPTVQALWHAVLMFELLPAGFSNRQLRAHLAQLLGQPAQTFTQVRMSYKSATVTFAWLDRTHSKSPPVSPHQLRTSRGSVLHSSLRRNLPPRIGDGHARRLSRSQFLAALL